jgi:hypothetical protein
MNRPTTPGSFSDGLAGLVDFGEPTLDNEQVSELAGADRDVADRLWRALGFPDVPERQLAFTEQDARALRLATEGLEQLRGEERERALDAMLHETRIVGASLANLAESARLGRHPAELPAGHVEDLPLDVV